MAGNAGHRDASRYVGKCLAQTDTLDGYVSSTFPRAESRNEVFHLPFRDGNLIIKNRQELQ